MAIRIFLLITLLFGFTEEALAALSCTVTTTCNSPDVVLLRMSATSNAHAELPSQSNYPQLLCCTGVTDLANSCTNDYGVVLRLSGDTNAHVEENTEVTAVYDNHNACLSVPDGTVSIGYQNSNCNTFDTTIASISSATTNAHIGAASDYVRKVCGTVTATATTYPTPPSGSGNGQNYPLDVRGCRIADLNCDGKVNILDLSILLYYYEGEIKAPIYHDLNNDGRVDFRDISIMFYYWDTP